MQCVDALTRYFKGATGSRSLPLSFLAVPFLLATSFCAAAAPGGVVVSDSHASLARWHAYALSRVTPDFDWAERVPAAPPTALDAALDPDTATAATPRSVWFAGVRDVLATGTRRGAAAAPTSLLQGMETRFSGTATSTGLRQALGEHTHVNFGVVLVQQRFAAPSLGGEQFSMRAGEDGPMPAFDAARGLGLELDLEGRLLPRLGWFAGYRSQVNMDRFQNLRGIYGNPGDVDLPARMSFGLAWEARADTSLSVGWERIHYSGIEPFMSAALPRRLLAVLGDATSPAFSWRDLDVYSASVAHALGARSEVGLSYSTGQQPKPTSRLLSQIMMREAPSYSVGLSWAYKAPTLQWRLAASYAPSEFILGIPSSARRNRLDGDVRELEFESTWLWQF